MSKKVCNTCKISKPFDEFGINKSSGDGLRGSCKECRNSGTRANYAASRDSVLQYQRRWRAGRPSNKESRLFYTYGLTIEQYNKMLADQGNKCSICLKIFSDEVKPHVDHDHSCCPGRKTCGRCVRGLLCKACNVFLGYLENAQWKGAAEAYLSRCNLNETNV